MASSGHTWQEVYGKTACWGSVDHNLTAATATAAVVYCSTAVTGPRHQDIGAQPWPLKGPYIDCLACARALLSDRLLLFLRPVPVPLAKSNLSDLLAAASESPEV